MLNCRDLYSVIAFPAFLLLMLASEAVFADTIWLKNGDLLRGAILKIESNKVVLATDWAGDIKVDLDYVQSLESDKMLWVRTRGQNEFRLLRLYQENNQTWLQDEQGNSSILDSEKSLVDLTQDRPGENQWLVSGEASVHLSLQTGETEEHSLQTSGSVNVRDRVNRNELKWDSEHSRENGKLDDQELKVSYDYNRFLTTHWYILGHGQYWHNIDESPYKRWSLGSGLGYQFWDNGTGSLKTDLGLSHLWEDYRDEGLRKRWAIRWGLDFSQRLIANLYGTLGSEVFYRLGDSDQILWDLNLGLKYEFSDNFFLNTRYSIDFDSNPPDGNTRNATSLTFGLGYSF